MRSHATVRSIIFDLLCATIGMIVVQGFFGVRSLQQVSEIMARMATTLSIVIPVYNEADNLPLLYRELNTLMQTQPVQAEIIIVDDGSSDASVEVARRIAKNDKFLRILELSRNFGKEVAVTAGLHAACGDAAIIMDADMQHPVDVIPEFITKWQAGADVVVGVRRSYGSVSWSKKLNSWLFYKAINSVADIKVVPHSTDFRLLDRVVIDEFNRFSERNRFTRGLIDWLGFKRDYVYFHANERASGEASYSLIKLVHLAINSFVGLSLFPLRLAGYLGIIITFLTSIMATLVIVAKYGFHNHYAASISFRFLLVDFNSFMIGIVLISLGLIALYVANVHNEVINRPLYVVRREYGKPAAMAPRKNSQPTPHT